MAGVFQCNVFQQSVFQNNCAAAAAAAVVAANAAYSGAPPIQGAWEKWWESAKAFEKLLAEPETATKSLSPAQLRLLRRQKMYEEMLMDASPGDTRKIEAKLRAIREKIGGG